MSTSAAILVEPEKDRWWLICVSILWQQGIFISAYIFPRALHASSAPVAIIWFMSFILPGVYLGPISGKAYLRTCAKIGWLYVLAAIVSDMCSVYYFMYQFGVGDLTVSNFL